MSAKKLHPEVKKYLHDSCSKAGKAGTKADKSAAGKAGAASRWASIPRCPCCKRPATEAQLADIKVRLNDMQKSLDKP